jgi:lipopolysaccharide/colanic/teichoic acid biosynthesis glycosyltransferase
MKKWEKLPDNLRREEIRPYYDHLKKHPFSLALKRCMDFLLALVLLLILWPVMLIIGILVGTTSRGGVFFCQERVTTYGRIFRIIKFRTMVADAEKKGTQVTTEGDSRVTAVGKFLRKVRLDELPQLINILKGDMSIVGTRPEVPRYVAAYTPEMMATLLLPAGVTSKASIAYKDEDRLLAEGEDVDKIYIDKVLPEKMKYNLEYLMEYSPGKDFLLMFQTVLAVWRS